MRITSLVSWAGPLFEVQPGDTVDVPEDVARDRIAAGLAEPEIPLVEPVAPLNPPRRTRGATEANHVG